MLFRLTNTPATCQALVNNIIRAHLDQTAIAYLDNILVYLKTQQEHTKHVKDVLRCLQEVGLKLNPKKCEFNKPEVKFLRYIIGIEEIKIDSEKIKVIQQWPTPTSVKEVQAFLGFANFNRQFIKNYSQMATPLTELTKKDVEYRWTERQQKVFQQLKDACAKKPRTKKLDHIKVRLFSVEERTGPVNIRLRLLRDARVQPNFHILMIELADQSTPLQETFHYQPEEEQEFEVEHILKRKGR